MCGVQSSALLIHKHGFAGLRKLSLNKSGSFYGFQKSIFLTWDVFIYCLALLVSSAHTFKED